MPREVRQREVRAPEGPHATGEDRVTRITAGTAGSFASVVTGALLADIRDLDPKVAHRRVAGLNVAPTGAQVVLLVGCLAVNLRVCAIVREQLPRLSVQVLGDNPHSVQCWVGALRNPSYDGVLPGVS
jgi:hypothetical protein